MKKNLRIENPSIPSPPPSPGGGVCFSDSGDGAKIHPMRGNPIPGLRAWSLCALRGRRGGGGENWEGGRNRAGIGKGGDGRVGEMGRGKGGVWWWQLDKDYVPLHDFENNIDFG